MDIADVLKALFDEEEDDLKLVREEEEDEDENEECEEDNEEETDDTGHCPQSAEQVLHVSGFSWFQNAQMPSPQEGRAPASSVWTNVTVAQRLGSTKTICPGSTYARNHSHRLPAVPYSSTVWSPMGTSASTA